MTNKAMNTHTMKPVRTQFLCLLAGLLILVGGSVLANAAPVVSVVPVESDHVSPTVMVSGKVQSRFDSALPAGIAGTLTWVAEPGTQVSAGEPLAELERRPFELAVREIEAKLARKEIEIQRLTRDLARYEQLHRKQSVSSSELDNKSAELAVAEADRELLEVELEQARDDLAKTRLAAPFAGMVTKQLHQRGEAVSATEAVVQLVNTERLEIRFHGPLQYSDFPAALGELTVYFREGTTRMPVRSTIPVSDAQSQSFVGHLDVPAAAAARFRIGELVSVAVPTALPSEQYIVPRDALVLGERQIKVFVLDEELRAIAIPVVIGADHGDYVSVTGSLAAGQRVIVRGAETVRNGQVVRILSATEFPVSTLQDAAKSSPAS
ncbi:efflux RND transporter periplasmic adaptor subunit [Proteobacteria bacterium 005FR1]|nr:efflux RND transporter periplasmic adaptor subunit [Proteobacteria bacterium 005FR1]